MYQLLSAGMWGILAFYLFRRSDRRSWGLLLPPALFGFLSLDEVAQLHEQVGHRYGPMLTPELRTGLWVAICLPIFAVALWLTWLCVRTYFQDRRSILMRLGVGVGLLIFSAVVLELLANLVPDNSVPVHIAVMLEEVGEMCGATVVLWGSWEMLRSYGIELAVLRAPKSQQRATASMASRAQSDDLTAGFAVAKAATR